VVARAVLAGVPQIVAELVAGDAGVLAVIQADGYFDDLVGGGVVPGPAYDGFGGEGVHVALEHVITGVDVDDYDGSVSPLLIYRRLRKAKNVRLCASHQLAA
jgi:hypothetical protein